MLDKNLFQNILESFRVRMGDAWTKERTAQALGISRGTYSKWVNGHSMPKQVELKRIATTFQLNTEEEDILYRAAAKQPDRFCTIPFPQNPFFTGRESYLEQIGQLLAENSSVAVTQPVSISGLGGIGKTQLAIEYAYRAYHKKAYRTVFWIDAAERTTIEASYVTLARRIGLPEQDDQESDRIVQAVKQWLEGHTNWLLIMDNADDLQLARSFFPVDHHGHILLTTRSQIVGTIAKKIEITEMEPAEGLYFLLRRSGVVQGETQIDTIASDIRKAAQHLVELLGRHPLALDQTGAYIEETCISCIQYLNLYRARRNLLLHRQGSLEDKYSEHPETVATTFELSLTKASERHPLAVDILRFCSFLQPDVIPEELLQYDSNFKVDITAFNEGIAALRRYSLIKCNTQENMFSMHRLVQAVLIDNMSTDIQRRWKTRVVRALNTAFPETEFHNWSQCERLLPHALVCATWAEKELTSTEQYALLFCEASKYLFVRGKYSEAESLMKRAILIFEHYYGANHPLTAYALDGLSFMLGDRKQAELLTQQVITILKDGLGDDHPLIARSLFVLAGQYWDQERYGEMEELLMRALFIWEKHLGAEHPNIAKGLCQLANLYLLQGKDEEAEVLLQRALRIFEEHLEAEDPDMRLPLFGLIILLHDQGKNDEAVAAYQRIISIEERRLGSTHPTFLKIKSDIGDFLYKDQHIEAEVLGSSDEPPKQDT